MGTPLKHEEVQELLGKDKWGRWKVSEEIREERLSFCKVCEHKKMVYKAIACGKCGCIMQSKVRFTRQKCPIGKW